jgi:hypothetical protein
MNMSNLDKDELKKIQIMNSFVGMNPTGQLSLNNGVFKSQGNPAQIMTTAALQKQSLQSSANNTLNQTSNVKVNETFENKFENKKNILFSKQSILFIILFSISIFIFYKNKIKK